MIVHDCEQGSDEWFAARAGIPTASEFKKLITSQGKPSKSLAGYAMTLSAEAYAGKPLDRWEGNSSTERGHELEPEARASYEFDNDVITDQVGFVTSYGAGCSPDSLVGSDGLLEIKCRQAKGHVEALLYHHKHKKCPPDYYAQVQGQMFVCERDWCDLLFHHPDLPALTIRVERDKPFLIALATQIELVIAERDLLMEMLRAA